MSSKHRQNLYCFWPTVLLPIVLIVIQGTFGAVRLCEKYDEGNSLRCIKDIAGMNGDNFGRVGIINKSHCDKIRYVKQEWTFPCGTSFEGNAMLQRFFPGEVLRFGDFQQDMVLDFIQLQTCGELRILECHCGRQRVKCGDHLYAATYKRGEHTALLDTFEASKKYQFDSADDDDCCMI